MDKVVIQDILPKLNKLLPGEVSNVYVNIVFICYMVAVFSGLISISVMVMTGKKQKTSLVRFTTWFAIVTFFYCTLYFIFYYRERVLGLYELALAWRLVDYIGMCIIIFFWILVMMEVRDSYKLHRKYIIVSALILSLRVVFSLIMTSFFMDDYYNIIIKEKVATFFYIEAIFVLLSSLIMIVFFLQSLRHVSLSFIRIFIISVTLCLLCIDINQCSVDYNLYQGNFGVSAWNFSIIDPTGILFSLVNLMICYFILKTDFSPIYFTESQKGESTSIEKDMTAEEKIEAMLDIAAEKHMMTKREREVMELVYEGMSNPQIAEELFVSRNTVKRHIDHIFAKAHVSTRIELIHLVNSQEQLLASKEANTPSG